MKNLFALVLLLFVFPTVLLAQQELTGSVKGKLIDSTTTLALDGATITIFNIKDSSSVAQSLSKTDGSFHIQNIPFGTYTIQVSFQGYATYNKAFNIEQQKRVFNAGILLLIVSAKELETVIIRSSNSIAVKGDTTEFNAASIKTKANATAEDLLKKIPGVEVDKEGGVKAQGEDVARVMIDGKLFFGNDAKMATQNLPTDIIDKIQIIDAQSEQSAFTGFDDGIQEKVINIVTKKNRRKGYFGKGNFSIGNDGRYGTDFSLNRFNENRKISLIGKANNTNLDNYSISDILQIINSGGFGALHGTFDKMGQSGVARTYGGGLNYNDILGIKTEVNGSYRYNNVNNVNQSSRLRETFVAGDSSLFNNNVRYANTRNINHHLNFEIDHQFDSSNSILVRPSFSHQRTNNYNETNSILTRGKSISQKDVRTINNSLSDGYEFNNTFLFRHRFQKPGRTLSVRFNSGINKNHTDRTAFNYTNDYSGGIEKLDTTNRISDIDRESISNSLRFSYTEPITSKSILEVNYDFDRDLNLSDQKTNSYNKNTGEYDLVDTILSNNFKNISTSQRAGINYKIQLNKEWNYTMGVAVQRTEMSSNNLTKNNFLSQSFDNLYPSITLQYRKNRKANFRLNYRGRTRQPNITQLQDIVDNTNLYAITRGNPGLKQEFSNDLNFRYTKVDAVNSKNFLVRFSGSLISNKISNAIIINTTPSKMIVDNVELEPLAQYSKPVNIDGAYNVRGYINYGFALKQVKSNINVSTNLSHTRDVSLVNNIKGYTRNYVVGERIRITTNINEVFDLNFSSTSTYNMARNTLRPELNRNYFTQVFSVEPTLDISGNWIISSDFDYTRRTGQAEGYNQSIPLLNASISRMLFRKKQGELKFSVFDLLNENKSITRNVEENYIEDVRTNVLQRYFLLSFVYNFKTFGS